MGDVVDYDKWKLQAGNKEERIVAECLNCGYELHEGEECIDTEDGYLCCDDCFDSWAWELLGAGYDYAKEDK